MDVRAGFAAAVALLAPWPALAVPGPDSTAVLANAALPESVALAQAYAAARDVPARRICSLDLPTDVDMTLDDFRTRLLQPLQTCLQATGALEKVEAVVVMRGVPLRVTIGDQRASLAAVLGVWRSTTLDGKPLIGQPPGTQVNCGSPCLGAAWANPFRDGAFAPGWRLDYQSVHWRPILVTRLDGRSYEDATKLIDVALAAEGPGGTAGEFLLMEGADSARGVLDREYQQVMAELQERGVTASIEPFQSDLTGRTFAGFVTGTAGLGQTIEGNAYVHGALTDNLTSLGALPENFTADGEAQVSIARWIRSGAAGAHGATDEPLNNAFPSRRFLVDYVDGYTLAESYLRRMPFAYWQNLVIGDPMLAAYAVRPEVTVELGACTSGKRAVHVTATDAEGFGVSTLRLLVDGVQVEKADGATLDARVAIPARAGVQVLAVAQKARSSIPRSDAQPKGWTALTVDGAADPCVAAKAPAEESTGCGSAAPLPGGLALLGLLRRRSARAAADRRA
jgi:uncharacterized protein (TIGR03790 family)